MLRRNFLKLLCCVVTSPQVFLKERPAGFTEAEMSAAIEEAWGSGSIPSLMIGRQEQMTAIYNARLDTIYNLTPTETPLLGMVTFKSEFGDLRVKRPRRVDHSWQRDSLSASGRHLDLG